MGAYGALLIGEQHPDAFRAIVASSPSVWRSAGEAAAGAFDDPSDFARNDVLANASALRGDHVRIDCGDDDVFAEVSRDLLAAAPGSTGGVHPGYHESPTWRSFVPGQLEFLRTHLT
jgi:S-formylglutathione hydrolase FrmB